MAGTSRLTTGDCTAMGVMTAATPSTNRMFAMLLPTTLPIASPGDPAETVCIVTANSGADVAKETTVSPTTKGDIPTPAAMALAPRTRTSPPPTSSTRPVRMAATAPTVMAAG